MTTIFLYIQEFFRFGSGLAVRQVFLNVIPLLKSSMIFSFLLSLEDGPLQASHEKVDFILATILRDFAKLQLLFFPLLQRRN